MDKRVFGIGALVIIAIIVIVAIVMNQKPSNYSTPSSASTSSKPSSTSTRVNNSVVVTRSDYTVGSYLADPSGNPLYTYDADTQGVSKCTGACLSAWSAYQEKSSTTTLPTDISTIQRSDNGQAQYTYRGMPLYFFTSDNPGQVTGNGMSGFSIAKP